MLMRILMVLSLSVVFSIIASGQYVVTKVTGPTVNTTQDGFYYALPRTVLKVELLVEKNKKIRGPLADYAADYLGTSDIITGSSTDYRILDVAVTPTCEADPDQVYYVQFASDRSKDEGEISFQMTREGTLLAFGEKTMVSETNQPPVDQTLIFVDEDDRFKYFPAYNRKKKLDTITRKITIDTVSIERFIFKTSWVDKSEKDRAEEAAQLLAEIREARFHLISGYQEVNYGESIKYMDHHLQRMERQYLELFLGKETISRKVQTVYYIPGADRVNESLLTFEGGGEVRVRVTPSENLRNLPDDPQSRINNAYYRIPDRALVEIVKDGEVLYSEKLAISQLGKVATVPLGNTTATTFDPLTGALKTLTRK